MKTPKVKQPKIQQVKAVKIKGIGLPKMPRVFGAKKR